ncbi:hypothetical protein GTX14_04705 [Streptomyces sp. SID4944]|nr:hypothetical protein [Streptomyces sp. SID4944]
MSEQGTHFWYMSFFAHNSIGLTAQERSGHWTRPRHDSHGRHERAATPS